MKKVMLTAFEPFDGQSINPSLEAALVMTGVEFAGATISVTELPVDRFRATETAISLARKLQPDVVIMMGEAGGRFRITPERVAINMDDFRIPDNAGNQPRGEPIAGDGPVGYFSTLPIRAITERLLKAHIPAAISDTAATFLCNRLFYGMMHFIATEKLPVTAGFIHVPYMHEQVLSRRPDVPSLSRETIVEGVRLAIETTLDRAK
jgi:pyroglutamyl-peptidase